MHYDYAAIAGRIESLTTTGDDLEGVMQLMMSDSATAKPLDGIVKASELPHVGSVESFQTFILDRYAHDVAGLDDIGRSATGHHVGFEHRDYGNDYGASEVLGAAMWAAYVRLIGRVGCADEDATDGEPTACIETIDTEDGATLSPLQATARRHADVAIRFTTPKVHEDMLDQSYATGSVHRAIIGDILHDGIESGEADPVRAVARALTILAGEQGGDRRILAAAQAIEPFVLHPR